MKLVLVELIGLAVREAVFGKLECWMLIQLHHLFDVTEQLVQARSGATVRRSAEFR